MGGMGRIGRIIKDAGRLASKKRKPPKKFDAMTEGRKVSQAKKKIKNKKSKEAAFAEIGRIMKEAGIGQKQRPTPIIKKSDMSDPNYRKLQEGGIDALSNERKKQKLNKPTSAKKRSPRKLAKGGGKIYTSTDKKYGGGIFPRKGKM